MWGDPECSAGVTSGGEMGKQREFPNKREVLRDLPSNLFVEELFKDFKLLESLILAQDERWRRA